MQLLWLQTLKHSKYDLHVKLDKCQRFFPEPVEIIHWNDYKSVKLAEKNIFNKLLKYKHKKTEWFEFTLNEDEILLIAGKGHETTQIIGSQVLPFSDIEIALDALI